MDISAITFTELRYVVAVADNGHFGRAAAACHVSQPTLSTQIKKLEEQLGAPLFERGSKRTELTLLGNRVVERARVILEEMRGIGELANGDRAPLQGTFRLGTIPTLGPYILPWLLRALPKKFTKLRLLPREGFTATLLDELSSHRLDAALLALPVAAPALVSKPLFDEPFFVLAPASSRLATHRQIRTRDLDDQRVLLLSEGHCLRGQALEICGQGRGSDDDDLRATSLETIRYLVAAGMGCTLLPALAVPSLAHGKDVVARPFSKPAPNRRIGLVWRRSLPDQASVEALSAFIRTHLPAGVLSLTADESVRAD